MLTITALARRFGLARSTLMHYDQVGLLRPARRSAKGYRHYGEDEARRLEEICTYRRAGLSLEAIARILGAGELPAARALEQRLSELDAEMAALRAQQRVVADLLARPDLLPKDIPLDKATWVDLLRASGLSDADMDRWHATFERTAPDKHQRFLEALGIPEADIRRIRTLGEGSGHD